MPHLYIYILSAVYFYSNYPNGCFFDNPLSGSGKISYFREVINTVLHGILYSMFFLKRDSIWLDGGVHSG